MKKVYRIMFVCLGNICRSPMAQMIFLSMVRAKGLSDSFIIESAGTSAEELGNPIYPPARRELSRRGVPFTDRGAVKLDAKDYGKYDLFVGMDSRNVRNMRNIFGGDPDGKIVKLLDYTDSHTDVADPWCTGDFSLAYSDIERGCRALLDHLIHS